MHATNQMSPAINTGLRGLGIGVGGAASNAIAQTEIDGELAQLQRHVERLEQCVIDMTSRLYPVLSSTLGGDTANAPQPVMNSPMGQTLRSTNDRLYEVASALDSLRARIQL